MNYIFFGLITLAFIAAVGIFILTMIELRSAARTLSEFVRTTENSLKPALDELQLTLRSMRGVTDNVTTVTDDVRMFSSSVREIGENIKNTSELIEDVISSSTVKVSGLRAGIRAALEVILKSLFSGKGR